MKRGITLLALCCGLGASSWAQPADSVRTRQDRERELEGILDNYRAAPPAPVGKAPGQADQSNTPKAVQNEKAGTGTPAPVTTQATIALPSIVAGRNGIGALPGAVVATAEAKTRIAAQTILPRLIAGEMSVSEAWQKKALSLEDIQWILGEYVDAWGGFDWKKNVTLRRELARVAWENSAELQKQALAPKVLSRSLRLWLADYLGSVGDERAVSMCEQILQETPLPATGGEAHGDKPLVFQTVERIGWFYRDRGQPRRSAESWERLPPLYDDQGWWIQDAYIEAARLWQGIGNVEKANALYAKLYRQGSPWIVGMAYLDQARAFLQQGRHAEGRQLLQRALTVECPEPVKIALISLQTSSYYLTGEFEASRKSGQAAVTLYHKLPDSENGQWLSQIIDGVQGRIRQIEQWTKQPFICEPQKLHLRGNLNNQIPLTGHIYVRSFQPVALLVTSNNPLVKTRMKSDGWSEDNPKVEVTKKVEIRIAANALSGQHQTVLVVSSPQYPEYQIRMPIEIEPAER